VRIVSTTQNYNPPHSGSLQHVVLRRYGSCYTKAMREELAGLARLVRWKRWKINIGPSGCEGGNGLVRNSTGQTGQFVQNSTKLNGTGAMWKHLAERSKAGREGTPSERSWRDRRWLSAYFTCTQQHEGQPSTAQRGVGTDASQTEQTKQKERDCEDDWSTKKQTILPPTYQNSWSVTTNACFTPL
jgi:hypothetical protein